MAAHTRSDPADVLERVGRHWGWVLAFGIITVLVGILVLVWPGRTLIVVAVLFGIQLIVMGIFRFASAFGHEPDRRNPDPVRAARRAVVDHRPVRAAARAHHRAGAGPAAGHLLDRQRRGRAVHGAVEPRYGRPRLGHSLGILGILAGIVVLVYPAPSLLVLALVLGIWLLVFGIMEIVAAFRIRSLRA